MVCPNFRWVERSNSKTDAAHGREAQSRITRAPVRCRAARDKDPDERHDHTRQLPSRQVLAEYGPRDRYTKKWAEPDDESRQAGRDASTKSEIDAGELRRL